MKIHFVCTGNVFRSRLAEAYLLSKKIPAITVSSSGIEAEDDCNGRVCWYTRELLKKRGLEEFLTSSWHQSQRKELENQDLVIFLKKEHQEYCLNVLGAKVKEYEVWEIEDIPDEVYFSGDKTRTLESAEAVFKKILKRVDELAFRIGSQELTGKRDSY